MQHTQSNIDIIWVGVKVTTDGFIPTVNGVPITVQREHSTPEYILPDFYSALRAARCAAWEIKAKQRNHQARVMEDCFAAQEESYAGEHHFSIFDAWVNDLTKGKKYV